MTESKGIPNHYALYGNMTAEGLAITEPTPIHLSCYYTLLSYEAYSVL